ncbi:putative Dynactin 6 protein [Naja naja]|nr:putative Dynactin 6 protein [Naja naja]
MGERKDGGEGAEEDLGLSDSDEQMHEKNAKSLLLYVFSSVKIAPGAVVCVESEIKGDVTIGPRTVVHPKARIIAEAGPIVIGEGNLIEEQAIIINGYPENVIPNTEEVGTKPMVIGTNNVFEVGCSFVGKNVILTSGCIIGACCNVNTYEVIPENTVIYGADCLRRVQTERPQVTTNITAGLSHENPPKLSSSQKDDESNINTCEELKAFLDHGQNYIGDVLLAFWTLDLQELTFFFA